MSIRRTFYGLAVVMAVLGMVWFVVGEPRQAVAFLAAAVVIAALAFYGTKDAGA